MKREARNDKIFHVIIIKNRAFQSGLASCWNFEVFFPHSLVILPHNRDLILLELKAGVNINLSEILDSFKKD